MALEYTNEQIAAIKASPQRDALLVALAGSGKTTTVAWQVAYLLRHHKFEPRNIAALTYSVRAADALLDQITRTVETKIDDSVLGMADMGIGTMHAWAAKLLRDHVRRYERFEIWDDAKRRIFVRSISDELGIGRIRRIRSNGSPTLTDETHDLALFFEVVDRIRAERIPADARLGSEIQAAFTAYVTALDAARAWDYPAIFSALHDALSATNDADCIALQECISSTLRVIIVDEAQDLSAEMWVILDRLHTLGARLWLVADQRQCIFTFRAADAGRIERFAAEYKAEIYPLSANFRATDAGVEIANLFLSKYLMCVLF